MANNNFIPWLGGSTTAGLQEIYNNVKTNGFQVNGPIRADQNNAALRMSSLVAASVANAMPAFENKTIDSAPVDLSDTILAAPISYDSLDVELQLRCSLAVPTLSVENEITASSIFIQHSEDEFNFTQDGGPGGSVLWIFSEKTGVGHQELVGGLYRLTIKGSMSPRYETLLYIDLDASSASTRNFMLPTSGGTSGFLLVSYRYSTSPKSITFSPGVYSVIESAYGTGTPSVKLKFLGLTG